MPTPIETVMAFMAQWQVSTEAMRQSFRDYFTDETVWENVGMSRTVGPDQALALLDSFSAMGAERLEAETFHAAAVGDVVLTERIDRLVAADGREILAIRLMGIFELKDGKITAWRDYFDTAGLPGR